MQTAAAVQHDLHPSVLIVDPDSDTRLLYRTVFGEIAHSIVEAEDGAEALGKAICASPSVILTETRLRGLDGYALCQQLRREIRTRAATIVIVTATVPVEIVRATTAGADGIVSKPCLPDALVDTGIQCWKGREAVSWDDNSGTRGGGGLAHWSTTEDG